MALASLVALIASLGTAQPAEANPWRELHRPLDLPAVRAGEDCPVSAVDERVPWDRIGIFGGFGIGPGPAYPGLGRDAHLETTAQRQHPGWFASKVFWYVRPRYRGPVLVRGRRLDEQGPLGFAHEGERSSELRIGRHDTVLWNGRPPGSRGEPTGMRVRGRGCYGAQIDGTSFSRTLVFTVSTP